MKVKIWGRLIKSKFPPQPCNCCFRAQNSSYHYRVWVQYLNFRSGEKLKHSKYCVNYFPGWRKLQGLKLLSLHMANHGLLVSTTYGSLSTSLSTEPGVSPEHNWVWPKSTLSSPACPQDHPFFTLYFQEPTSCSSSSDSRTWMVVTQ